MSDIKSEVFDFFMDKDEYKVAEDNFRSALFSSDINSQKMFKDEYFSDDLPLEWKTESSDFNVDELLGSYLVEGNLGSGGIPSSAGNASSGGVTLNLKDDDFEPFRDLVSLPFDAVMDTLDPGLEAASDSGLSTDNLAEMMLSPSSGATSPEPRGDISVDTLDAASDVSSTSDLGSMGSEGSSPNAGSGQSFPVVRLDLGGTSLPSLPQDDVEVKDCSSITLPEKVPTYITLPSVASSQSRPVLVTPHTITKLTNATTNAITLASTSAPSAITTATATQPPIATRSIKVELAQSPKVVKPVVTTTTGTALSTATTRSPILTKVRLDAGMGVTSTPKITTISSATRTSSPQTIVVTQAGKANPLIKNSTVLKAGGGRSILLPVNVSDLNQVRTIKIISASGNNATNKSSSSPGVRTLVSTVRPVGSSTTSATGSRATFYTTSKGSDGRSLLKVTPTALVPPTTHSEVSRVSVTPSYMKDDQSDDETPLPNQELVLTDEERKLMKKEGLVLPSRYPLTKQEERDLKRIRRKIRNKISAQDSRKRKKEYVDGLEDRVKNCTEENQQLQKRIKTLEKQNETLLVQLKRFQNLVGGGIYYNKPHNHTSTALMMLILSAALFVVPSLRSQDTKGENELTRNNKMPSAGHSRSLLEARNSPLNLKNMDGGFLSSDDEELDSHTFSPHALSDHDYAPATKQPRLESSATMFSAPSVDKTMSRENGDPPDTTGGLDGVAALIGAMLDRLGGNWTDPGGSFGLSSGAVNRTPPHSTPERASVVVNLNHGKRLRDDIELE